MERKPLEVESTEPSSAVYGGSVTAAVSVEDDVHEEKVVYRGWKVMPFIIGNANKLIIYSFFFLKL